MKKQYTIDNFFVSICIVMFAFLPTSKGTRIYGVEYAIFVWGIASILVITLALRNIIDYGRVILVYVFGLSYMFLVTIIAQEKYIYYHVSLARIVPLLVLALLFEIKIVKMPSKRYMLFLLNIFSVSSIIWNIAIIEHIKPVMEFTYNNFSQYFENAVYYSVIQNAKPVMTFGVHTYAAYFYFIFFLLNYYTYEKLKKNIYLVYALCFMILTLFLVSTTAIIFFVMMFIFFCYNFLKKKKQFFIFIFILVVICIILISNIDYIYLKLHYNITNGENSFISRYSSQSVFVENVKIITSSLGIGFNVISKLNIGYSDSGYVVYLTMGSVPLLIYVYYNLFKFLQRNISIKYRKIFIILIFAFEFALPASFQYRFIYMIIFVVEYLNMLVMLPEGDNIYVEKNSRKTTNRI